MIHHRMMAGVRFLSGKNFLSYPIVRPAVGHSSIVYWLLLLGYVIHCSAGVIRFLYVVCGCETWSLTLREERRLRVFKNRVLRRIFGPKRDEVAWEWRRLNNKEPCALYSNIRVIRSRRLRWVGHVVRVGERRDAYRVLVGKPEKKETTRKTQAKMGG